MAVADGGGGGGGGVKHGRPTRNTKNETVRAMEIIERVCFISRTREKNQKRRKAILHSWKRLEGEDMDRRHKTPPTA